MRKIVYFLFIFILTFSLNSQALFDEALSGSNSLGSKKSFDMNGYVRVNEYVGKKTDSKTNDIKQGLGELSLKFKARKGEIADAFSEVRFGTCNSELDIREAYVNFYLSDFSIRGGHQIIVWGRADGVNPTNNLTPYNYGVFSPNEDDKRIGNFLYKMNYNLLPLRFEGIWIPSYVASNPPTITIPGVEIGDPDYPDNSGANSSFAGKVTYESSFFDGSISYYDGYSLTPIFSIVPALTFTVQRKSFRWKVYGVDFSTSLASLGLRGEVAYKEPYDSEIKPELQYVVGSDQEYFRGKFSLILQYIGKTVFDWKKVSTNDQISYLNQMIFEQTKKRSHSIFFRVKYAALHETLNSEIVFVYNISTEEFLINPKFSYDFTDGFKGIVGFEYYTGPDNTMYNLIRDSRSAVFAELSLNF